MVGPFAARQIYLHYKSRDASKRVTGVCIIQSRASQGEFQIDPATRRSKIGKFRKIQILVIVLAYLIFLSQDTESPHFTVF